MFRFYNFGVKKQGIVTTRYPDETFVPPEGTLGMPDVLIGRCDMCGTCAKVCPVGAIIVEEGTIMFDMGRCIFCAYCTSHCPKGAIFMSQRYELVGRTNKDLEVRHAVKH